jgi:hypothetical protein
MLAGKGGSGVGGFLHELTVASATLLYEDRRGEESSCWCTVNHKVVLSSQKKLWGGGDDLYALFSLVIIKG